MVLEVGREGWRCNCSLRGRSGLERPLDWEWEVVVLGGDGYGGSTLKGGQVVDVIFGEE